MRVRLSSFDFRQHISIIFSPNKRILNLLAPIHGRYEHKKRTARDEQAEGSRGRVAFVVCNSNSY